MFYNIYLYVIYFNIVVCTSYSTPSVLTYHFSSPHWSPLVSSLYLFLLYSGVCFIFYFTHISRMEKTVESSLDCKEIQPVHRKEISPGCSGFSWSWNSNTLATSWEELTHWKRPWCWEGLGAGGEGNSRGWDGWMASPTQWAWVWVDSGSWWWTGRPGVLQSMGSQRVGHDWTTELNWTEVEYNPWAIHFFIFFCILFVCGLKKILTYYDS